MSRLPLVAIVGAPNVGKSTLVNRILGRRQSVVADEPGTTRDRSYSRAEWTGREFSLVDTGGMEPLARTGLEALVTLQARVAVDEADVIMHLADSRLGVTEADAAIAKELRGSGKPVLLVVNKLDNPDDDTARYDFYALGEGEPHAVSAVHGIGTGDLLDDIVALLPETDTEEEVPYPRIAVVGRPNVGKSTLLNVLLGAERAVVSEVAGTTTDAVAHEIPAPPGSDVPGGRFLVLDTAGVNKSARKASGVPYYSTLKTEGAIRRSDVSLLLVDAVEGLVAEDLRIARQIEEAGRTCGVLVNKSDLVDEYRLRELEIDVAYRMTDLKPPLLAISALSGAGVDGVIPLAARLHDAYHTRIPTHEVAEFVNELTARTAPPKGVKIRFATQTGTAPPRFSLFATRPTDVPDSYARFLENSFRERYGLRGVSVRLRLRSSR
ncbi:MAG: ribosome biogenesis GTPase Der [Actinomycetota bacterium]|nr:ribosome biogenesis GTPase Der [Actinomycetota bacterium]